MMMWEWHEPRTGEKRNLKKKKKKKKRERENEREATTRKTQM